MVAIQKAEDRIRKCIIGIAHDHVGGVCDVGIFGMWGDLSQMCNGFFGNKVARRTANEMQRKR
jgi:hypothetical protein